MRSSLPLAIVAIIGTLLSLDACARTAKAPSLPVAAQAKPSVPAAQAAPPPLEMKPNQSPPPKLPPTPGKAPGPGTAAVNDSRVAQASAVILPPGAGIPGGARYFNIGAPPITRMPIDFRLGALEDRNASNPKVAPLLGTLTAFLDGLVAGSIPDSSFLKGRRRQIDALVGDLARGPEPSRKPRVLSWRLGSIVTEADSAVAPIALYAAIIDTGGNLKLPPRAIGEIRARYVDKLWFVEDISFSVADLGYDRDEPKNPYEPPVGSDLSARGN
ncbi:MAG: hypothetical protein WCL50_11560 [Spirochaetota bacterium]